MAESLYVQKKELRQQLRLCRTKAFTDTPHAALAVRDLFLESFSLPEKAQIACYLAQGDELDPLPLTEVLVERGHSLCLPVVDEAEHPLSFRSYQLGDFFCLGAMQIPEPLSLAPLVVPDVLLVPLVGFDRGGRRLGQGGGFYDRTLALLRAQKKILAVGLAYAAQEVPQIPTGEHDVLLGAIVTEKEVIRPSS
ncbi:MAG: 5-formyltetrahydrofolate cyclo-ligase [Alphaproteobacteria bacterium]|nr:5-formyltetrahydrofolate cyclo-ligase [Alphaproteobacteria bacterium]